MADYEYGRIRRLDESLRAFGVAPDVAAEILEGGEAVTRRTSPAAKADWMREAMCKMDRLMDPESRQAVRETCACCLGGKRLAITKAIARDNATLEERIAACNDAPFVFGNSVALEGDGSVTVRFFADGEESYRCACLPQAREALPITYCYCCGGHVKKHLQAALGRKLAVTVLETALSSAGKRPCTFSLRFADGG
ncbi:MAG TPA: hypothetical protein VGM37_10130 [Armatimonadota bacterium]|jgi:hypothetical protein